MRRVVITPRPAAATVDPIRRVWAVPRPGAFDGEAVLTWEDAVAALPVKARARRHDNRDASVQALARSRVHGAMRQHRAFLKACRPQSVEA